MSQAWPQGFKKPPEKCSGAWGPIFDIYRSILVFKLSRYTPEKIPRNNSILRKK